MVKAGKYTVRPTHVSGEFIIGNELTNPEPIDHGTHTSIHVTAGGDPEVNARQRAVAAAYTDEDRAQAFETAADLARAGAKMTLLEIDDRGRATARECTGSKVNQISAIVTSKGDKSRYHHLQSLNVVDVASGHGKARQLAAEYNRRAAEALGS